MITKFAMQQGPAVINCIWVLFFLKIIYIRKNYVIILIEQGSGVRLEVKSLFVSGAYTGIIQVVTYLLQHPLPVVPKNHLETINSTDPGGGSQHSPLFYVLDMRDMMIYEFLSNTNFLKTRFSMKCMKWGVLTLRQRIYYFEIFFLHSYSVCVHEQMCAKYILFIDLYAVNKFKTVQTSLH